MSSTTPSIKKAPCRNQRDPSYRSRMGLWVLTTPFVYPDGTTHNVRIPRSDVYTYTIHCSILLTHCVIQVVFSDDGHVGAAPILEMMSLQSANEIQDSRAAIFSKAGYRSQHDWISGEIGPNANAGVQTRMQLISRTALLGVRELPGNLRALLMAIPTADIDYEAIFEYISRFSRPMRPITSPALREESHGNLTVVRLVDDHVLKGKEWLNRMEVHPGYRVSKFACDPNWTVLNKLSFQPISTNHAVHGEKGGPLRFGDRLPRRVSSGC